MLPIFERVEIPDVVRRIGPRIFPQVDWARLELRDKVAERRMPYFSLWLPCWSYDRDEVTCCYRWLRLLLTWSAGHGIRINFARHPRDRGGTMIETDRALRAAGRFSRFRL